LSGKSQSPFEPPRTAETIAEELYELLKYVGVSPPYILVGHGIGGLYVRLFAAKYIHLVKDIILIDTGNTIILL
jgi:pimeloyl-ACP methyl ester carboxylesterase